MGQEGEPWHVLGLLQSYQQIYFPFQIYRKGILKNYVYKVSMIRKVGIHN